MDVKIYPSMLDGTITAKSSKSVAHRALIASALAEKPTKVLINGISVDVKATIDALIALGADIKIDGDVVTVNPIKPVTEKVEVNVKESGSTFRFLLPIISALSITASVKGEGRLPDRPIKELLDVLDGVSFSSQKLPFTISGQLKSGTFKLRGDVSSQYISGLLFALPILDGDSEIVLETPLQSKPYVDLTIDMLEKFGIEIIESENGYLVKGGQTYKSPIIVAVEGDWSNASYFILASAIGNMVRVVGLNENSKQGDKVIRKQLISFKHEGTVMDVKDCPDLVPTLAVAGCFAEGNTLIKNAERLRLKESNRLEVVAKVLTALGGKVKETSDGLFIEETRGLKGGEVDSFGDHRIAMCVAIAATKCEEPTIIRNAEAVNKSYPTFFEDFKKLGGKMDVL